MTEISRRLDDYQVVIDLTLAWSELDQLGHANNARYFTWFEEARMAHFKAVEIPTNGDAGWGPILASTRCDFLAPVAWPAQLRIGSRVTRTGRSSFTMEYAAFIVHTDDDTRAESTRCVAVGQGVVVLVRYGEEAGEKVYIDDALRARLET